jgi:predicted secreted protein
MSWTTALAIYFVAWWIVLFVVLPFGVRSQHETGEVVPGTDPGAPVMPRLVRVVVWTTILTAVLCGVFFWLFLTRRLTLDDLATLWGLFPS